MKGPQGHMKVKAGAGGMSLQARVRQEPPEDEEGPSPRAFREKEPQPC